MSNNIPFQVSAYQSVYFRINGIEYRISDHKRTKETRFDYHITNGDYTAVIEDIKPRINEITRLSQSINNKQLKTQ